uniref:DUF2332 family protein n=1 Tax=Phenylobacterium glaciei TaxID=2803784 RepID=A0A974P2K0_9CAUL|nr:DUF2332 family protein [Phenylobacterium glaciei]
MAWTARVAAPQAGAVTVLYHSVFWQYMPPESQVALAQVIADHGAAATRKPLRLAAHGAVAPEHGGHGGAADPVAGRPGTASRRGSPARRVG